MNSKSTPAPKKKEDGVYDLEQQFILRMPPGPAMALRRDVESGAMNLKDKLSIELHLDNRKCFVRYGGQQLNARLVDLPTIIENLKTTDRKTFYKTADICQMLVCVSDEESSTEDADTPKKPKDKDKKHIWNHGITPPLKNVRKRRFRKTLTKKYQEQPDIEKEVKRLFRMDNEAIDVKWEVVVEEQPNPSQDVASGSGGQVLAHGETNNQDPSKISDINPLELAEHEIFGEVSSSEDEDKDINIMDSGEEETLRLQMAPQITMESVEVDDTAALQEKLQELTQQLQDIRGRRLDIEMDMSVCEDVSSKQELQKTLDNLMQEDDEKQREYEILSSMVGQ